MLLVIANEYSKLEPWQKALIGGAMIALSIVITVATAGAALGPQAALLGGKAMLLSMAAKAALVELAVGVGFAVIGWVVISAITGNWSLDALTDSVADAIFFTGLFMFISSGINALKSISRCSRVKNPKQKQIEFPPNNGAVPGSEEIITLETGVYGRYGGVGPNSRYITNHGASPSQLSLPPWNSGVYNEIHVLRPIKNVEKSIVASWAPWNGVGGGVQYLLPKKIKTLIVRGYIKII